MQNRLSLHNLGRKHRAVSEGRYLTPPFEVVLVRRQCAKYRYFWWRRSCKKLAQTCADQPQKAIPARATRPFSETLKKTRGPSSMKSGSGREAGEPPPRCRFGTRNKNWCCSTAASSARRVLCRAAMSPVNFIQCRYCNLTIEFSCIPQSYFYNKCDA